MSAAVKKSPAPGPGGRPTRSASPGATATARTPSRSATPTNGVSRTRSLRTGTPPSARGAVKKPGSSSLGQSQAATPQGTADEDARAEAAALIQELKERLQKAETVSDELQKQVEVLQSRLDDALKEQSKMEEQVHAQEELVDAYKNEKKETFRHQKELETAFEAERAAVMKEREEAQVREEELHGIIQRLKENLAQKFADEEERPSRATGFRSPSRNSSVHNSLESGNFAPQAALSRSNSQNNSKLLHQKDKIIESLRLEIAETQIKLLEIENIGGGRMQELDKELLTTRMANARLLEENESFQLLLRDQTLNGDFARGDFMRNSLSLQERPSSRSSKSKSLADELEETGEDDTPTENTRRLEAELKQMTDKNKAMTLYINKIIERVLQHNGFETILDQDDLPSVKGGRPNMEKELPPPPAEFGGTGFLQRTRSVTQRTTRPRPSSQIIIPSSTPLEKPLTEDPDKAPSIPIKRSQSNRMSGNFSHHRRNTSTSEWGGAAATVVNNMYRPPSGQMSPGISTPRNSIFSTTSGGTRHVSSASTTTVSEESFGPKGSNSTLDTVGGDDIGPLDAPSPPRSVTSNDRGGNAVIAGNKIRPLRLVQETEEAAEAEAKARKQGNRTSWFGGLFSANNPAAAGNRRVSHDQYPQSAI